MKEGGDCTILHVQAGFIHVICLGISNKSVVVHRQDSIRPYWAHAVLSGHCNIYVLEYIRTGRDYKHRWPMAWRCI